MMTFEQLPHAVEMLAKEINEVKQLLLSERTKRITEQENDIIGIKEAARFLNIAVPTIYSKVSKSELPVMKRGKRLYFSRTDLLEYIKEGRRMSYSEAEAEAHSYIRSPKR